MSDFLAVLIGAALVNNLILTLPLGSDALRAVRVGSLGPATALLILLAAPLAWMLQHWLLEPLHLQHLQWLTLVALLAPLAWLSLRLLARVRPAVDDEALWPLSLVNGAVLGGMLLAQNTSSLLLSIGLAIGAGLGFWLALQLLADLLQRVEACPVPPLFKGTPVRLISAGLAGMALLGLNGMGGA